MIIQTLEPDDTEQTVSLVTESAATVREDFDEGGWEIFLQPNTEEKTRARIVGNDYLMIGAKQDEKLLGMIAIYQLEKIDQLFVSPAASGKGIATRLWNHARQVVDAIEPERSNHGYYWVRSSFRAVPVYQRFGFQSLGEPQVNNGIRFQLMEKHPEE
ncbi:MAG: GNAT family N-acetyltransferase [Pseudomonadota bacterium]